MVQEWASALGDNRGDGIEPLTAEPEPADLDGEDAEKMIGKTIAKIEAAEYMLCITFTDGSSITCGGWRWDGCALGAEYSDV